MRLVNRRVVDLVLAVVLALSVFVLYRKITRLWWTYDDAFHFHQVMTHSAEEILTSPTFWRGLPNRVFTPLLFLSIKADLRLFGLNPHAFYVRHLVALMIATVLLYFTCRMWLPPAWSFAGAMIGIAGPPMCDIAAQLYHRHYVEGLILSLGAVIVTVSGIRRRRIALSIAGALLYFLAMSAKEVFVPLLLLIAVAPEGSRRDRIRYLAPWVVSLALYAAWRISMLGPSLTGYGWTATDEERPRLLATIPLRMLVRLGGADSAAALVLLALIALALVIIFVRFPRGRLLFLAGALAAILPVVPVSFHIETRYVLTLWILISIALPFLGSVSSRPAVALIAIIALATLIANRREWSATWRLTNRMSIEGRALAVSEKNDLLLSPAIPPAALAELRWLTNARGAALYDELPVCEGRLAPGTRLLAYADSTVKPMDRAGITACNRILAAAPLEAAFRYTDGVLWWTLGPRTDGQYRLIVADGVQAFDMPRAGGFRIAGPDSLPIRVRYQTPDGSVTYSPALTVPLRDGREVRWHR